MTNTEIRAKEGSVLTVTFLYVALYVLRLAIYIKDSVAQWIRRWSTEPEILGSIPSRVVSFLFSFFDNP
jgi:hypothetical protein